MDSSSVTLNKETILGLKGLLEPFFKFAAAMVVFLVALLVSSFQQLGMEKELAYSIVRPVSQLSLAAFALHFILFREHTMWIFVIYPFTVFVAGYTAGQRAKHVPGATYVAGASIFVGSLIPLLLLVSLRVFPFKLRYIIPVAGMMVGRAMTVTGVTLNRLLDDLRLEQNLVEAALALGATPRQASKKQVRRALVIALAPVLDTAKTYIGLVSLPGAMTGMMVAGASPMDAIMLQIVVLNMMLCASILSSAVATSLSWHLFFTKTYQLQEDAHFEIDQHYGQLISAILEETTRQGKKVGLEEGKFHQDV